MSQWQSGRPNKATPGYTCPIFIPRPTDWWSGFVKKKVFIQDGSHNLKAQSKKRWKNPVQWVDIDLVFCFIASPFWFVDLLDCCWSFQWPLEIKVLLKVEFIVAFMTHLAPFRMLWGKTVHFKSLKCWGRGVWRGVDYRNWIRLGIIWTGLY